MKCECGGDRFFAHQEVFVDVIVDGDNEFWDNAIDSSLDKSIYEASKPYGPYQCIECKKVYEYLDDDDVGIDEGEEIGEIERG